MVVPTTLIDDFSRALSDLDDVLCVKVRHKNDMEYNERLCDAQIFSFLRAHEVLKALLATLCSAHEDDQMDIKKRVALLCEHDILDEKQAKSLLHQCEMADFLAIFDKMWLYHEDELAEYEEEVEKICTYYQNMKTLLTSVGAQYTPLEQKKETVYESH